MTSSSPALAHDQVEDLWSQVYLSVADALRESKDFGKWLEGATNSAAVNSVKQYWKNRGWLDTHHAVNLGKRHLQDPARTVGMMLAVNLPKYRTLRFAFPIETEDLVKNRTVLDSELLGSWFPEDQQRRHQHAQINMSFIFGLDQAVGRGQAEYRGLAYACIDTARPQYCSDVAAIRKRVASGVRSLGEGEEDAVGMATLLYLPFRSDGPHAYAALALYSPIPDLFGAQDPGVFSYELPSWIPAFATSCRLELLVKLLRGLDDARRSGLLALATGVVTMVIEQQKTISVALNCFESQMDKLDSADAAAVEALRTALDGATKDAHFKTLRWVQQLLTGNLPPIAFHFTESDLVKVCNYLRKWNQGIIGYSETDDRLSLPLRLGPDVSLPKPDTGLDLIASIVNGCVHNAASVPGPIDVAYTRLAEHNKVQFIITNKVSYDYETLKNYWIVRQGHPVLHRQSSAQSGTRGLQLFLVRLLKEVLPIELVVEVTLSTPTEWICTLTITTTSAGPERTANVSRG